jgi:hypothetical protein
MEAFASEPILPRRQLCPPYFKALFTEKLVFLLLEIFA